jgi:hypothetical protein
MTAAHGPQAPPAPSPALDTGPGPAAALPAPAAGLLRRRCALHSSPAAFTANAPALEPCAYHATRTLRGERGNALARFPAPPIRC